MLGGGGGGASAGEVTLVVATAAVTARPGEVTEDTMVVAEAGADLRAAPTQTHKHAHRILAHGREGTHCQTGE